MQLQWSHAGISQSDFNNCRDLGKSVPYVGNIVKVWLCFSSGLPILPTASTWDIVYINEVFSQSQLKHWFNETSFLGKKGSLLSVTSWLGVYWGRDGRFLADYHFYGNSRVNFFSVLTDVAMPAQLCKLIKRVNFASVNHHLDWLGLWVRLRNDASKWSSSRSLEPGYTPWRFVLFMQTEQNLGQDFNCFSEQST